MSSSIYNFSFQAPEEKKVGRSQGYDYDASYKDLSQCCRAIRFKTVAQARATLEDVTRMRAPIWYTSYNSRLGARSQLGGRRGRYPKKEARILLRLLANATANAVQKGLDQDKLVVKHASAFKQNTYPRSKKYWASSVILGYGKMATRADLVTARAEITVAEDEELFKKARELAEKKSKQRKHGKNK